jgi:ABC-type cobalamin/Fe3+-siderophores transport system ATPase subunit
VFGLCGALQARGAALSLTASDPAAVDIALGRVKLLCTTKDGKLALISESGASRLVLVIAALAEGKIGPLDELETQLRCHAALSCLELLLRASREQSAPSGCMPSHCSAVTVTALRHCE